MVTLTCTNSSNSFQINLPFHHCDPDVHPSSLSLSSSLSLANLHSSVVLSPFSSLISSSKMTRVRFSWQWEKSFFFVRSTLKKKWILENELDFQNKLALKPFVPLLSCTIHISGWTISRFAFFFTKLIRHRVNDLEALAKQCDSHLPLIFYAHVYVLH